MITYTIPTDYEFLMALYEATGNISYVDARKLFGYDMTDDVTDHDLKSRYRQLVKQYHPDADANAMNDPNVDMTMVNNAYEMLKKVSVSGNQRRQAEPAATKTRAKPDIRFFIFHNGRATVRSIPCQYNNYVEVGRALVKKFSEIIGAGGPDFILATTGDVVDNTISYKLVSLRDYVIPNEYKIYFFLQRPWGVNPEIMTDFVNYVTKLSKLSPEELHKTSFRRHWGVNW